MILSATYRLPKTHILRTRIESVRKTTHYSRKPRPFVVCLPWKRNPKISRSALVPFYIEDSSNCSAISFWSLQHTSVILNNCVFLSPKKKTSRTFGFYFILHLEKHILSAISPITTGSFLSVSNSPNHWSKYIFFWTELNIEFLYLRVGSQ